MDKINSLTDAQRKRIPEFTKKWIDIGLSCAPLNKKRATSAINLAYTCGGLSPPKEIVFTKGPKDMNKVCKTFGIPTFSVARFVYGSHEAGWLSVYDFAAEVLGMGEQIKPLAGLIACAKEIGWWIPYEDVAFVMERHCTLNRDSEGRLHCEDGPAVAYRDGFEVYAHHGVRVTRKVVMRKFTVKDIDKENNAEVRRVMVEKYGTAKYLQDSGAVLIHKDTYGELYRKPQKDDEAICMVKVINSTPEADGHKKEYWLGVPPTCTRAKEAIAWCYHETEASYNPNIET